MSEVTIFNNCRGATWYVSSTCPIRRPLHGKRPTDRRARRERRRVRVPDDGYASSSANPNHLRQSQTVFTGHTLLMSRLFKFVQCFSNRPVKRSVKVFIMKMFKLIRDCLRERGGGFFCCCFRLRS